MKFTICKFACAIANSHPILQIAKTQRDFALGVARALCGSPQTNISPDSRWDTRDRSFYFADTRRNTQRQRSGGGGGGQDAALLSIRGHSEHIQSHGEPWSAGKSPLQS